MKKKLITILIITLVLITITIIILPKDKKEYHLIELTGTELVQTILQDNVSITFALYNDKDIQAGDFYEDLKKTVKQANENIYYVNTNFVTIEFDEIISSVTGAEVNKQSYFAIQDGKIVLQNTYSNFKTMFKELNGKKYETKLKEISKEEKLKKLGEAKEQYKEGNIAKAFNFLCEAWTLEEAKEEYNNNPFYKILGSWGSYEKVENEENTKYTNFYFMNYASELYIATKEDKIEGFEKPTIDEYKTYDILVKEDYVYIKNKKNKYEKKYEIITISPYTLTLKDNDKRYNLQLEL